MNNNQLYTNPQNENLSELYNLLNRLVLQIEANRQLKESLIQHIDTLGARVEGRQENGLHCEDTMVFDNFIAQRASPNTNESAVTNDGDTDLKSVLRAQNEKLQRLLQDKVGENIVTYHELDAHEEALTGVTALLRDHVRSLHTEFVAQLRHKLEDKLFAAHEHEFGTYLRNVSSLHRLFAISRCYRHLLQALQE